MVIESRSYRCAKRSAWTDSGEEEEGGEELDECTAGHDEPAQRTQGAGGQRKANQVAVFDA